MYIYIHDLLNSQLLQDQKEMDCNIRQDISYDSVYHIHLVEYENLGDWFQIGLKN
jgi:hypothetical protein